LIALIIDTHPRPRPRTKQRLERPSCFVSSSGNGAMYALGIL